LQNVKIILKRFQWKYILARDIYMYLNRVHIAALPATIVLPRFLLSPCFLPTTFVTSTLTIQLAANKIIAKKQGDQRNPGITILTSDTIRVDLQLNWHNNPQAGRRKGGGRIMREA
jgi:hypothetical protein